MSVYRLWQKPDLKKFTLDTAMCAYRLHEKHDFINLAMNTALFVKLPLLLFV